MSHGFQFIGKPQAEFELAPLWRPYGLDLQQAMKRAKEGRHQVPSKFSRWPPIKVARGKQFPLVFFLAKFAKQFGSALMLGNDFMSTLTNLDLKGQETCPHSFEWLNGPVWSLAATKPQKD